MFEVRDGLGQFHTFATLREARIFASERGKFTWANVFRVKVK